MQYFKLDLIYLAVKMPFLHHLHIKETPFFQRQMVFYLKMADSCNSFFIRIAAKKIICFNETKNPPLCTETKLYGKVYSVIYI